MSLNNLTNCFNFELIDKNLNLFIEILNLIEPYYVVLIILIGLIGNTISFFLLAPNIFR